MRLIDADALMKAMYERAFETDGDTMWQSGCWVRYRAVEQVIKECPTIEPEPQWTPCSERFPEKIGRYLVTRGLKAAGPLWNRVYIVNYSDLMGLRKNKIFWQGNIGKNDFQLLDDVIAWMPLPEPYKED